MFIVRAAADGGLQLQIDERAGISKKKRACAKDIHLTETASQKQ